MVTGVGDGPVGLYRPEFEHDACGVGVVAHVDGVKSHRIIEEAVKVLMSLSHRGATGSDPLTGDGAGILIQMPDTFLREEALLLGINLPPIGDYGVGMIFLPRDPQQQETCERICEEVVRNEGQIVLGWRDVPTNSSNIGKSSRDLQPVIRQLFVSKGNQITQLGQFERKLYVIRKVIEQMVLDSGVDQLGEFYVNTLSSNKIVYKGLLMGTQLSDFYLDLQAPKLASSFAMVHSRFSTNTLGSWKLAHPYRFIVHNGEINTLRGNINWMVARQGSMSSSLFGNDIKKLFPVITAGASDTASIDNAIELLINTGRPIQQVMAMLIPEATGARVGMSQSKRDFYDYHACLMEPWDGPALIAFTDGTRIGAILDRNGLRPFRYLVTTDGLCVMASEAGVLQIPPQNVLYKSRIEPGRMFLIDPERGGIIDDETIKNDLSTANPYGEWLEANLMELGDLSDTGTSTETDGIRLKELQRMFGYTQEELTMLMEPMAAGGSEPVGSMGNDTPLAVLSDRPQSVFSYFKQLFAQVTNPPLDAIREELVTSLSVTLGSEQNLFEERAEHARQLKIESPVLTNGDLEKIKNLNLPSLKCATLSTVYRISSGSGGLNLAIDELCRKATDVVSRGSSIIILSDRDIDKDHVAIPILLATGAVHHHLIREGTRTRTGLVVESGEPREIAHYALLIGYGAGAVNPYLVYATLDDLNSRGAFGSNGSRVDDYQQNYLKAAQKGLLKIISKMGISTIQSYRGAQIFEAVGLSQGLVDQYFTWTPTRIGGIGLEVIESDILHFHSEAYSERSQLTDVELNNGGVYYWRRNGEYHMWNPDTVAKLQFASQMNDKKSYDEFAVLANDYERNLCTLRGLLSFKNAESPIALEEVEPVDKIVKRLATGAISLGAIGREAHETLAIAMNRIGARSNSGEGGEDYRRYSPNENGDRRHSAIKQVASGRFGVTTNYLVNASDLQIKMAQGSKPGEGGQLPGHKVDDYIGWVRNSTPGVELISPPPHHDIYSIEDLAQLIYDLKNVNSSARVHVKLVSEVGVGTIAAGVSKAHADVVLISGDSGGTGASPESSIKHAGLPWELGIAETQQVLVRNDLRGRIVVQADGQLKTGRDVAIACLLGAEEFGIATAALVTLGCIMLRKCHLNTCSVGIATQDPELRKHFSGRPESVINYFYFIAEEFREIMAQMGFRTVNEMVGRVDRLDSREVLSHWKAKGVDLSGLLHWTDVSSLVATYCCESQDHSLGGVLDQELIKKSEQALKHQKTVSYEMPIRNFNRTVGAMLSGELAKKYGETGLPEDTINVEFCGSAGQSFGAFLAKGITFTLKGDSNDYFGKGLSGGKLIVLPPEGSTFKAEESIIIGNVSLYGATGGESFIRGLAGERFCVRNSGAYTVVEGVGDHGCEYMTAGRVVVLGPVGRNFAAGMSGGIAYVLDETGIFDQNCNPDMVELEPVVEMGDVVELRTLIQKHYEYTGSESARKILSSWKQMQAKFVKVYPRDYKKVIEARKQQRLESGRGG